MPDHLPLTASGPRSPQQRPRPIPAAVRAAIALLVRGRDDDEDCKPLDLCTAAREVGITPHLFRKYLDRAEVRALLLRERKIFCDAICASNEAALQRVRDTSANGMSVVASVRALENLSEEQGVRHDRSQQQTPGVTIRIVNVVQPPADPQPIDVTPAPALDEPPPTYPDPRLRRP